MTIAYVYEWTYLSTCKWYVGYRTKAGTHPDDRYYSGKENTNDI